MAEQLVRLHQDGQVRYENHLNGNELVSSVTDENGNIDIYVGGAPEVTPVVEEAETVEVTAKPKRKSTAKGNGKAK